MTFDESSFSLLAVDDGEFRELGRVLDGHPTLHLDALVVDDSTGRLLDRYPSYQPDESVWDRIETQIDDSARAVEPSSVPMPARRRPSGQRLAFIGSIAAGLVALAAVSGLFLADRSGSAPVEAQVTALAAAPSSVVVTLDEGAVSGAQVSVRGRNPWTVVVRDEDAWIATALARAVSRASRAVKRRLDRQLHRRLARSPQTVPAGQKTLQEVMS